MPLAFVLVLMLLCVRVHVGMLEKLKSRKLIGSAIQIREDKKISKDILGLAPGRAVRRVCS